MQYLPSSIIFLFCATVYRAEACSCYRLPNATAFSRRAGFVSRVLVLEVKPIRQFAEVIKQGRGTVGTIEALNDAPQLYTVRHLDVYKSPVPARDLPTQVRTAADGAMCGVRLSEGQEIVLSGGVRPAYLTIHLCGYDSVKRDEAERMRTYYATC